MEKSLFLFTKIESQFIIILNISLFYRDGSILTCTSEGQLKPEKLQFDEIDKNNFLLKMAKWVVLDKSPTSKRQVCVYDDIALKSSYGQFFKKI